MDRKKIQKTVIVFTVWTFIYVVWFRWFLLYNWNFNIFSADAWRFLFNEWWYNGWIIRDSFWIYIIALFLFIPLWILGLCLFGSINYTKYYEKIFEPLIYGSRSKKVQKNSGKARVKRKKSYLEVRPRALAGAPQKVARVKNQPSDVMTNNPSESNDLFMANNMAETSKNPSFSRREVAEDFEGESPFETPNMMQEILTQEQHEELKEDLPAIMENAGAVVISNPEIDGNKIDYLAVSQDKIFLVLTDDEDGDWLADEERFNDEDPLWFSETTHRTSPITILKNFETDLKKNLTQKVISTPTQIILVKTNGNIINAEDMTSVWEEMDAIIARSSFGLPEELPSFAQAFPTDLNSPDDAIVEKIKSIVEK